MVSAPSSTSNACTAWQISTICASGTISRMTPFIAPTKWSLLPKSVVRVIIGCCAKVSSQMGDTNPQKLESNCWKAQSQGTEVIRTGVRDQGSVISESVVSAFDCSLTPNP